MKTKYTSPELELIMFGATDIITTSASEDTDPVVPENNGENEGDGSDLFL